MSSDNVIPLPSLLERLAADIFSLLKRDDRNREEWIEINEALCLRLAEARREIKPNIEFSQWCEANGFGKDILNHQDRAAAIAMGREPNALRKCLEATERRSLQHIYMHEFGCFTHMSKTASRRKDKLPLEQRKRPSPQVDKAKEAFDKLVADGIYPGRTAVSKEAGVGERAAQLAIVAKRAEPDPEPLPRDEMRPTMQKRFDAAVKKAKLEARDELKEEVYKELDVFVRHAKERSERADRILASYKGVMSRETFRRIKACLHPDHNTFKFAAEALQAFSDLEDVLVKPEEDALSGPPLPTTAAELMARRRQKAH